MHIVVEPGRRGCELSRRRLLAGGCGSALGWALSPRWAVGGRRSDTAQADAVLLLWLWGGPSHLDTWDPKPAAPREYRGPFSPIPTRVPGIQITELFPRTAEWADRFTVIRSLHTASNDHGVAATIGLTGSAAGALNLGGNVQPGGLRPAMGSTIARFLERDDDPLPFVVIGGRLHQGKKVITGEGGGALGARYDPLRLEYQAGEGTRIPALELPDAWTGARLGDRRRLQRSLNEARATPLTPAAARMLQDHYDQALSMLAGSRALDLFDLDREPDRLRDEYGRTRFGQSCLLARRLVERGVPFVQVNWSDHVEAEEDAGDGGWDLHYRNFQIMQDRHAAWLDRALSALLADLEQRGMLERTLVLAVGEFGRTPKINEKAGRDHWEHCYAGLLAGGGVRGGQVWGESDRRAERPINRPCTPADLVATVQHAVGISTAEAQALNVAPDGRPLHPLFS